MGDGELGRTFNPSRCGFEMAFFVRQVEKIMFFRTMTRREMASLTGLTSGTVSRVLHSYTCSAATMRKFMKGLQLTMQDILEFRYPWEDENQ
jgi:DNA-binding Xre family transcriptional regulator